MALFGSFLAVQSIQGQFPGLRHRHCGIRGILRIWIYVPERCASRACRWRSWRGTSLGFELDLCHCTVHRELEMAFLRASFPPRHSECRDSQPKPSIDEYNANASIPRLNQVCGSRCDPIALGDFKPWQWRALVPSWLPLLDNQKFRDRSTALYVCYQRHLDFLTG